jgi:hypothetical protein
VSTAGKITTALKKYGRSMTLRRRIGTTNSYNEVVVKGVPEGYRPAELLGGLQQGDRQVTIGNAEIAAQVAFVGPPKKGDLLVIEGAATAIQGVETKYLGADILAHVIWVRG